MWDLIILQFTVQTKNVFVTISAFYRVYKITKIWAFALFCYQLRFVSKEYFSRVKLSQMVHYSFRENPLLLSTSRWNHALFFTLHHRAEIQGGETQTFYIYRESRLVVMKHPSSDVIRRAWSKKHSRVKLSFTLKTGFPHVPKSGGFQIVLEILKKVGMC